LLGIVIVEEFMDNLVLWCNLGKVKNQTKNKYVSVSRTMTRSQKKDSASTLESCRSTRRRDKPEEPFTMVIDLFTVAATPKNEYPPLTHNASLKMMELKNYQVRWTDDKILKNSKGYYSVYAKRVYE
jgi:hypothetical protein